MGVLPIERTQGRIIGWGDSQKSPVSAMGTTAVERTFSRTVQVLPSPVAKDTATVASAAPVAAILPAPATPVNTGDRRA